MTSTRGTVCAPSLSMLPHYIIQEIRDREEREREQVQEQPRLEIPMDAPRRVSKSEPPQERDGPVEIQIW